ncbi:MAG: FAD-dependent oxidoreductase [Blastochloris sp.]|nr:FAD-dependent oxidoreductase [Blastochloris sp.]
MRGEDLIVGAGIAGCLLARSLLRRGRRVHVVDAGRASAASASAAWLINPVTGDAL